MRPGWEIKTIGEVCEIRSGRNQKEVENPNGMYPIYGSGGIMGYADDYLCDAGATIIGRKGSINNPIFVETKFWNVDTAFGFSPKETILPKYLFYFCKGFNFQAMNKGTTIPSLVKTDLLQIRIPITSLPEQQRIVDVLDQEFAKIDALKANAEKSLQAAKDLFQATLKKELEPKEGWERRKLNDIYDVRDGTHDSPKYYLSGYPLVTSKNLRNGVVDLENVKLISKQDYDKINERSKVDIGDVLFAMIGTIGNPCLVEDEPNYAIKNMALFKVPKNQSGKLLKCILSTDFVLNEMRGQSKGSNQPFVSLGYLRNYTISIPISLEEQVRLVAKLDIFNDKCEALQQNYQKTLSLCDDLKQALLRKALNGEL